MAVLKKKEIQIKYSNIWKLPFKEKIFKGGKGKIK